ncbi:hypothetical protein [Listeria innocua]|uniref:hypothetical protein n=1 Tax=Listeria innocua TaxID=1642 RepID=UPI00162AF276|nr:hypothetical protein [Listeria innocua]MBC1339633.1 hypothetical protein [Listeria innocua]
MNILLADYHQQETKRLIQSLSLASIKYTTAVIHYEGDLPFGFYSPFTYFTGWHKYKGEGLFFNEIKVPSLYEIRHRDTAGGTIYSGNFIVGKFHYFKNTQRIVKQVDWLDLKGSVVFSDCYSIQGFKYATQLYSPDKKLYQKNFLDTEGNEVINWNLITGTITLKSNSKIQEFPTLTQFASYFVNVLQKSGEVGLIDQLFINSLSFPLFVADNLTIPTTLFWQEIIKDAIPQNMVNHLNEKKSVRKIIFESDAEYKKVYNLHAKDTHVQLHYLSPLEKFERAHKKTHKALVLTRSDNLHHIEEILDAIPQLELTIAAPTEMSQKLYSLKEKHASISLIPSVSEKDIATLLKTHDIYLDINAGSEVDDCVYQAYRQKYVILGFNEVAKNPRYAFLHPLADYPKLIEMLQKTITSPKYENELVNALEQKHGAKSTIKQYQKILKNK